MVFAIFMWIRRRDLAKAVPIIVDAKTQYVSACNTVETILIHEDVHEQLLPMLKAALDAKQVELRGTKDIAAVVDCMPLRRWMTGPSIWTTFFLQKQ